MNDFNHLKPFRFFSQKILPVVYDDALSYYEVLAKLTRNLNETNNVVNQHSEAFNQVEEHFEAVEAELARIPEEIDEKVAQALAELTEITFKIVFGETTKAEALEAINAGKIVYFERFNKIFIYTGASIDEGLENSHYFTHFGINPTGENILVQYASLDSLFDQSTPIINSYPLNNSVSIPYGQKSFNEVDSYVEHYDVVTCEKDGAVYMLVDSGTGYYKFGGVTDDHKFIYLTVSDETPTRWEEQTWTVPTGGIYIQKTSPSDHDGLWVDPTDASETSLDANAIGFDASDTYDPETVGKELQNLSSIASGNEWSKVTDDIALTKTGVTIEYVDKNNVKIYGTATAQRRYLFLNGQAKEATNTTPLDITLPAGTYKFNYEFTGANTGSYIGASKSTFVANNTRINDGDIITFDSPVMIGIFSANHANWGTSDEATNLEIHIAEISTKKYDLYPTGDNTNRITEIGNILSLKGCCYLAPGDYYIGSRYLDAGISLVGAGKELTRLIVLSSASNYGLRLKENSNISNLTLEMERDGEVVPVEDYTVGLHGIEIGVTSATNTAEYNCVIENVNIKNFTGCGIFVRRIGQGLNSSLFKNVKVTGCSVGFYFGVYAEYNIAVNCWATNCYTGFIVIGGNNIISDSIIGGVEVGINLPAGDGYSTAHSNDAHGIISNCKITHTGEYSGGAGLAFKCGAQTYSELISGCMIVGTFDVKDRGEILHFSGCSFRGQAPRFKVDNSKVVATGCSFENSSSDRITLLNDGVFNRVSCVDYTGEVIVD